VNTKIIFVDDDPMLLASTRRQLRRKLEGCEMLFFERATEALESMEHSPADIVLSDLRMPSMDGAEFLSIVLLRYPDTIRLAWTGQSEIERLNRVASVAHQVFSKPCPTETLIDILNSAIAISRENETHQIPLMPAFEECTLVGFSDLGTLN